MCQTSLAPIGRREVLDSGSPSRLVWRLPVVVALCVCFLGSDARGGFDAGVLIKTSPHLEASMSHVLVGRLAAFHEREGRPNAYLAEIEVSSVEKGEGVPVGSRIFVRFTSPKSLESLKADWVVSDCGDRKIDPRPGEWLRLYTRRDGNGMFIADHPACFFSIGKGSPLFTRVWIPARKPGFWEKAKAVLPAATGVLAISSVFVAWWLSTRRVAV